MAKHRLSELEMTTFTDVKVMFFSLFSAFYYAHCSVFTCKILSVSVLYLHTIFAVFSSFGFYFQNNAVWRLYHKSFSKHISINHYLM